MSDTAHDPDRARRRRRAPARVRDYVDLLKPRVMSLVVFTGLVGVLIAPAHIHPFAAALAVLAIALGSGAAGAINMWYERDLDALMARTRQPAAAGRAASRPTTRWASACCCRSSRVLLMAVATNYVAAGAARGGDPVLRLRLHDLAEAPHAAEHRDRRRRRRLPADDRLGRRDRRRVGRRHRALPADLPVDAAALLGAGALSQRRLSPRRRADAAGGRRPARDQAADAGLHAGAGAGGAGADPAGRGRLALRRGGAGAEPRPSSATPSSCGAPPTTAAAIRRATAHVPLLAALSRGPVRGPAARPACRLGRMLVG